MVIGTLAQPEPLSQFLQRVSDNLNTNSIRYVGLPDKLIKTVAVCGGSGADLMGDAMRAGADAYLTADITYHRFFDVLDNKGHPKMALIDVMHYETEACTEDLLQSWLSQRFTDVSWIKTAHRTSPIQAF